MNEIWRKLKFLFRRAQFERDLDEEMRLHMQLRNEADAGGRRFGNATSIKETSREMWSFSTAIDNLLRDIRYGARVLLKSRGFTAIAVLTLALGIGASTAVFSVVDTILLKPLPYPQADKLVMPWLLTPKNIAFDYDVFPWGPATFRVVRDVKAFQYLGMFRPASFNLTGLGEPEPLRGLQVSYGFFPALGVHPSIGRFFTPEEDTPGNARETILSDRLWRERFNADRTIVGRTVQLNGEPHLVVGVMPAGFAFARAEEMPGLLALPPEPQLWVPLAVPPVRTKPEPPDFGAIARLAPGWTIERAQAEMQTDFVARMERLYPASKGAVNTRLTPLAEQLGAGARTPLMLILAAVGVVLLIATSNVASLVLARSLGRRREFTVRAALGAGSSRLIRQILTESLLLASAAGGLGILIGQAGVALVKRFGPASLIRLQDAAIDWPVFAFALAISIVTGVLFGIVPAVATGRADLAEALKEAGRSAGSSVRTRFRSFLVISEVALAMILVVAAGLLTRTFGEMLRADPGFRPEHLLTCELSLPASKYPDQNRIAALYLRVAERVREQPGVEGAGVGMVVPLGGETDSTTFRVIGRPEPTDRNMRPYTGYTLISPGYFSALGIPLFRGREILDSDRADSMRVVVINRAMATRYFAGEDPIGKQVDYANNLFPPMTIVGVVGDAKQTSLREIAASRMYAPLTQKTWTPMDVGQVAMRTKGDPAAAAAYLRQAIHSIDPNLPVAKMNTMTELIDASMSQTRFTMLLLAGFGGLALVLASIGLYGVISYSVAQRTPEIGIRMAIGAGRGDVFRMVIGQGARLALAGIAIGVTAALGITRLMASFLYGVKPSDPLTFVAVALLLAGVALLACCVPARRATRVDPMIAVRYE